MGARLIRGLPMATSNHSIVCTYCRASLMLYLEVYTRFPYQTQLDE